MPPSVYWPVVIIQPQPHSVGVMHVMNCTCKWTKVFGMQGNIWTQRLIQNVSWIESCLDSTNLSEISKETWLSISKAAIGFLPYTWLSLVTDQQLMICACSVIAVQADCQLLISD